MLGVRDRVPASDHDAQTEEREFYGGDFTQYMAARGQAGGADPEQSFEKWKPEGERRRALLEPWLKPGLSVLEIGSATGFLLDAIRPHVGDELVGIEPGEDFREFSRSRLGIEAHPTRDAVADRRFDLVLSYYVVEHLRDPVGELSQWRELLNPGGRVAIEVPNVDDALGPLLAGRGVRPLLLAEGSLLQLLRTRR